MFKAGTMRPDLQRRLQKIAKRDGRKSRSGRERIIPEVMIDEAIEQSRGYKASAWRYLHFKYGFTALEIHIAFGVKSRAHVHNALGFDGGAVPSVWTDLGNEMNKFEKETAVKRAIRSEIRAKQKAAIQRNEDAKVAAERKERRNRRARERRAAQK